MATDRPRYTVSVDNELFQQIEDFPPNGIGQRLQGLLQAQGSFLLSSHYN